MAWNPSPEVAVARDAAKALGDVPIAVVVYLNRDGTALGVSSYGRTKQLCEHAGKLGEHLLKAAQDWE